MGKLWNRCVRWAISKFASTGLEQETNQAAMTGELAVPELTAAARNMAAEGIVLLKNEANTLPIRPEDTVAVFGRCAIDYFTVGYGSGGDVIAPYRASLMDGLRQRGVRLNEHLAKRYAAWCGDPRNVPDEGYWGNWPMCHPEMPLTEQIVRDAAETSTLALVVIGRAAGEDRENLLKPGSYYLTEREETMLRLVCRHFSRVCVILDCGNVMDMAWSQDYGSALVLAWQGGMESGYALADILTGRTCPSGRLTDTIAIRYEDHPTCADFGGRDHNCYTEDIYVGYRYFETFCPENVLYPFGFGLSYTTFSMTATATRQDTVITADITVTNTGDVPGKEVAQLYLTLPQGTLGNPAQVMVAFGKTDTLAPGQTVTLKLTFDLRDFAPFDDTGSTGFPHAQVLEAGNYAVSLGNHVQHTETILEFTVDETRPVRQLSEAAAPVTAFDRLINRAGVPAREAVPLANADLKQKILSSLPHPLTPDGDTHAFADLLAGRCTPETFVAQLSVTELDDLTHGQGKMNSCYGIAGNAGAFGGVTDSLRQRGIPAAITTDGPSGIRIRRTVALLPCGTALASSFNPQGVEDLYALISREMEHWGSDMLLAPGMNIHRNPLCGRNFEYFSEDPLLTGKIGAAAIRGIQSTGRSACPKHFACNNQERNRNRHDSRLSQRALREIYLRGFEIAVKESDPWAIMTSYNKINGVWAHYHYDLATQILRQEWGFRGLVITDWWMQPASSPEFPQLRDDAYRIRAQVDVLMPGELKRAGKEVRAIPGALESPDGLTLGELQRSALQVIRFLLRLKQT